MVCDKKCISVAIDGPVGVGKSTVAKALAEKLGFLYIDTGAMYRAVTLAVLENNIDPEDKAAVAEIAKILNIDLQKGNGHLKVFLDGREITDSIRTPEISVATSPVADNIDVRAEMVLRQQKMAQTCSVVMEGRDISTVVLPNATFKFFLDGDEKIRAKRRFDELQKKGISADFDKTLSELIERDRRDRSRPVGALTKTEDAILVDTTDLTIEEVIDKMYQVVLNNNQ